MGIINYLYNAKNEFMNDGCKFCAFLLIQPSEKQATTYYSINGNKLLESDKKTHSLSELINWYNNNKDKTDFNKNDAANKIKNATLGYMSKMGALSKVRLVFMIIFSVATFHKLGSYSLLKQSEEITRYKIGDTDIFNSFFNGKLPLNEDQLRELAESRKSNEIRMAEIEKDKIESSEDREKNCEKIAGTLLKVFENNVTLTDEELRKAN